MTPDVYCISIDRASRQFAIFLDFRCVRDFEPYVEEEDALKLAKAWVALRSTAEPEVVYPMITKMTMSTVRRRRRKRPR